MQFPEYNTEEVINSFLRNDSIVVLILSRSGHINSGEIERLENAKVLLFQDNLLFDSLLHTDEGIYVSNKKVSENHSYNVSAFTENRTLYATDYIPSKPEVLSLIRKDKAGYTEDSYYGSLEIVLVDEILQRDFYEIEIGYLSFTEKKNFILYPNSRTDKVILNENLPFYGRAGPFPFSDEVFNGDTITIVFNYHTPRLILNGIEQELDPDYILRVKIRKTSKNYYLYRKSVITHFDGQQPDFWNGIGNQINIHSNVEGGLGIFAGYSEVIDTLHRSN
jgi:hypothetical protein